MRRYKINGSRSVASPTASLLGLTGAITIRPAMKQFILGSLATPADNALQFLLQRFTAAGTSTGVTPQADDPADPASLCAAGKNHTVEPTYTSAAIQLNVPINQRGTAILYDEDGIKIPATAANGLGMQPVHSSFTGDVTCTIKYSE